MTETVLPAELPIFDTAFKANPHTLYASLRSSGDITLVRLPSGALVWIVTGYATGRALLCDKRMSKTSANTAASTDSERPPGHPLFSHLLTMDPPMHTELRRLLVPHFSARALSRFQPRVEALVSDLLNVCAGREEIDVLADFAAPLAFNVVCELVGLPRNTRDEVARALDDLERADFDAPERVPSIAQAIFELLEDAATRNRAYPEGDDSLLRTLLRAFDEGTLAAERVPALAFLILAAGRETTANLIANGMFRLLSEPGAWSALRGRLDDIDRLIEELLRLESPLDVATARYATADITIGDTTIRAGDTVFVGIAACNRDPSCFAAPDSFDPLRATIPKHLAFGYGIHMCIGAPLARLEARLALRALSECFPAMRLAAPAQEYEWKLGFITRGLQRLPVRLAG